MTNQETVNVLNGLIQTSEDGRKGFSDAAEQTALQNLRSVYQRCSADCAGAATELQTLVASLGGTAKDSGTLLGAALRGWGKVRSTFGESELAILVAAESAEDSAKAAYATALEADLAAPIRAVVQRQHEGAVRNHDLIRNLRNTHKAASEHTAG